MVESKQIPMMEPQEDMASMADTEKRTNIKHDLIKEAEAVIGLAEMEAQDFSLVHNDPDKEFKVWIKNTSSGPISVVKMVVDGLKVEQYERMKLAGQREPMYTYRKNIVYEETKLANDFGYETVHRKAPSESALIADRSYITTFYDEKGDDGSILTLASSKGNEALAKEYHKLIGKSVLAQDVLYYFKVE